MTRTKTQRHSSLAAADAARVRMPARRGSAGRRRRCLILVVVLVMMVLLSLLAASFAFLVRANMSEVMAKHYQFQARMAAESGIQRAILILRGDKSDLDTWFNDEEELRGILVDGKEESMDAIELNENDDQITYDATAEPAWRCSLIAPDWDADERGTKVRYGVTDECSKLDINLATESQLQTFFELVIPDDTEHDVDIAVLVDSLLDWREEGESARENGAKDDYYKTLEPPYQCKQGAFTTVEELLLVRGFTGWVLFGEDFNRNGLLDENEDDGEDTFPPDDANGELFTGIAPFLTVWSRENDVSADGRPRININLQDLEKLQEKLEDQGEGISSELVSYIIEVRESGKVFTSVMNLIPAPLPEEEDETAIGDDASGASAQGEGDDTTSQADNENTGAEGDESSDLDAQDSASENGASSSSPVPTYQDLTADPPPGTYDDLPEILDRLSVQAVPSFVGRINVSTAPREVLATIEELTDDEIDAIVTTREELDGEDKATPAWLLTENILSEARFRQILDANRITTQSSVYRIEAVGYADHLGVVHRMNVVLEMRGPIAQVLYSRDLNELGPAYKLHSDEERKLTDEAQPEDIEEMPEDETEFD